MSVSDGLMPATSSSLVAAEHVTSVKKLPDAPNAASTFSFQHIPELDGFRGLAVLVVVFGHYFEYRLPSLGRQFATVDKLGVLLFFVLSGFLITGLLHRERSVTNNVNFRRFYIRRALRLGPALLVFLFAVVVLMKLGWITDVPRKEIAECLFYVRNIFGRSLTLGHIWSLSLEEQFYFVWPFAFFLLPMKRSAAIVTGICVALATWRGIAIAAHLFSYDSGIYYMRPYFRFDSILIGAALVLWLVSSPRTVEMLRKVLRTVPAVFLWGGLAIWTAIGESLSRAAYISGQEVLVTVALAQIVLCGGTLLGALFRSKLLRYVGAISYSLYLWQQLFLVTNAPSWGPLRTIPLSIILPVLIAMASHHFIEKPLLAWKDRLAPQIPSSGLQ